jgi:RimJ/RimL family protein N-acetyltransferase
MEPVTLSDTTVRLRPIVPADAAGILAACQDPEIQRWTRVPIPYQPTDAAEFAGGRAAEWATGGELTFALTDAADPGARMLGCLSLFAETEGRREVGYWTGPDGRGRGLTTAAVRLVADFALRPVAEGGLGVARVDWFAEVGNNRSRAVAERAGFVVEGVLHDYLPTRDGGRVDAWVGGKWPT